MVVYNIAWHYMVLHKSGIKIPMDEIASNGVIKEFKWSDFQLRAKNAMCYINIMQDISKLCNLFMDNVQ